MSTTDEINSDIWSKLEEFDYDERIYEIERLLKFLCDHPILRSELSYDQLKQEFVEIGESGENDGIFVEFEFFVGNTRTKSLNFQSSTYLKKKHGDLAEGTLIDDSEYDIGSGLNAYNSEDIQPNIRLSDPPYINISNVGEENSEKVDFEIPVGVLVSDLNRFIIGLDSMCRKAHKRQKEIEDHIQDFSTRETTL